MTAEESVYVRIQKGIDMYDGIRPLDEAAMEAARKRQAELAKPPHSLGMLEDISIRLAGITGKVVSSVERRRILIFAADNGIVEEGVSSCPQSVTLAQTVNFTRGMTGVAVLAEHFKTELSVIDVGIAADFSCPGVVSRKVAHGTKNFALEPAMTVKEAEQAMAAGREAVLAAKKDGVEILGIGEMGIGNTTTSSAVLSALLGLPAGDTVSRGAGLTDEALKKKIRVIDEALTKYGFPGGREGSGCEYETIEICGTDNSGITESDRRAERNHAETESLKCTSADSGIKKQPVHFPNKEYVMSVLSTVGGFDLAAMAGAYLTAAEERIPVVIDGFISAVAALVAVKLNPLSAEYMFASHASVEKGYALAMNEIGLSPMLSLDMRLGEGSGCPLAFMIISAAEAVIGNMATFDEAEINDDYLAGIRGNPRLQGDPSAHMCNPKCP